jgi:type I restriction enzyme S subunit
MTEDAPMPWPRRRLKFLLAERVTDGPHETPEFLPEGVPFLSVDGIQDGELVFQGCRYISPEAHREYRKKTSPKRDDILMGKAASTGKIARVKVDIDFSIWSPLAVIRVDRRVMDPAFCEYALKSAPVQHQIERLCNLNTQKNIGMADIPTLQLPLPSLTVQSEVVRFLDRKTAAIDALVARKMRLIALLAESRSALIARAVTRGLNPDAPLKASGVEWLGPVPQHWQVAQVRRFLESTDYGVSDALKPQGTFGVLRMSNVQDGEVHLDDLGYVDSLASQDLLLREGDLLFNRTNSLDLVGKVGIFRGSDSPVTFASYLVRLRVRRGNSPEFLDYLLNTEPVLARARALALPSVSQANLNPNRYGELVVCVPPPAEQETIVAFLRQQKESLDLLIQKTEATISSLREYSQALITAAVAGRLDVTKEAA